MEVAKKLLAQGKPLAALERLKEILPAADEVWKVHELIGAAFHDLADSEGVAQAYLNAAQSDTILRMQRAHFSNYIFALHYLPKITAENLLDAAQIYKSLYREIETLTPLKKSAKKIHVAYISPHFLDSSAARFYESLLTDYDREKFFVTAWSMSAREDSFTKKIRRNVDGFFCIEETSFEEAALKIRDSGADILFDLGGQSEGGVTLQVAAYKPARVQISGVGYFDTTGILDYFLTDNFLADENFTEKLLKIENAFAFTPNEKISTAKNTNHLTIYPSDHLTFGCLNNFLKITDEYLLTVKKILAQVEKSKIIFRDTTPLESRRVALLERLKNLEIERAEVFVGADNFFEDYAQLDLILDTFPYNGGFMTALAIYMGVPVLNLRGKMHFSKVGADILRIAGLENFIAENLDEYIKKAVNFKRQKISAGKLTDTKNFIDSVYKIFTEMF
ncbi:MAG: hypothetical protein IJT73_01980 [Selenomonadaceae bacterium]|nr:hypothetical protein [Selenomonadaceae bacterium]